MWYKKYLGIAEGMDTKTKNICTPTKSCNGVYTNFLATYDNEGNISLALNKHGNTRDSVKWFKFKYNENSFDDFVVAINELYKILKKEKINTSSEENFIYGYHNVNNVPIKLLEKASIAKMNVNEFYSDNYDCIINVPNGEIALEYKKLKDKENQYEGLIKEYLEKKKARNKSYL